MSDRFTAALGRHLQDADSTTPQQHAATAKTIVEDDLLVETVEIPREAADGAVVLRGQLLKPSAEVFPRWLAAFYEQRLTPVLRHDPKGKVENSVSLRLLTGVVPKTEQNPIINLVLFLLTLISTFFAGAVYQNGEAITTASEFWAQLLPPNLITGWPYALTLMSILTAHEFGHYFAARYHRVAVTLPYFIPLPIIGFGTLGAIIRMKEPIPDRRKLFDIGVAGPLAGLVLAVPLLLVGLSTSELVTDALQPGIMLEGNSILYYGAKFIVFGETLPNFATGRDVLMNQVTFAAWIGLLVTAINLLPVGQLDGGHTVFTLFGDKARRINIAAIVGMAILGIAGVPQLQELAPFLKPFGFMGWFLWIGIIFGLIGPYHPPPLDDVTELDPARRILGYCMIVIFVLIFVPAPFWPI